VVPYHAFVGWEKSPGSDEWDYLETTLIGSTRTFEQACEYARKNAAKHEELATRDQLAFRRWSIAELRTKYGITPLE
jgi:hypothetical protein